MPQPKINILSSELLSDHWSTLNKVTFEYSDQAGNSNVQTREIYNRGDGATILLFNRARQTVVLTRQFRMPVYQNELNSHSGGMLIETCAGIMDEDNPELTIKRESEEETGYHLNNVTKVFQAYMSPGSVTEVIHFFVAEYDAEMKQSAGGGLDTEHEYIEVIELAFSKALDMIKNGQICDAKTIMLLQYAQINQLV